MEEIKKRVADHSSAYGASNREGVGAGTGASISEEHHTNTTPDAPQWYGYSDPSTRTPRSLLQYETLKKTFDLGLKDRSEVQAVQQRLDGMTIEVHTIGAQPVVLKDGHYLYTPIESQRHFHSDQPPPALAT